MAKRFKTPKPSEATWRTARLYWADFYNVKWPVCGNRLVWAVVGRKWVRLCTPVHKPSGVCAAQSGTSCLVYDQFNRPKGSPISSVALFFPAYRHHLSPILDEQEPEQTCKQPMLQPRCPCCGRPETVIWVHGHGQCAHCKMNVMPCCDGAKEDQVS